MKQSDFFRIGEKFENVLASVVLETALMQHQRCWIQNFSQNSALIPTVLMPNSSVGDVLIPT
jgi:hypothetical protein